MLIKTVEFDRTFNSDLYQISINRNQPLIQRGSYKIKPYGSIVSDIDLAQYVYASDSLLFRLVQIIRGLRSFIFVRLHCGTYDEFIVPWKIEGKGDCSYNPEKVREWVKKIEKLIDSETAKKLREKLFSDSMTIKNLLEARAILRPYSEILWDREDIEKGYKVYQGKRYFLVDQMKQGHVCVIRYLYAYKIGTNPSEYVSIDFGLMDKKYLKQPEILTEYYRGDLYKVFKSYKWYIEKQYFPEFMDVMKSLENYTGLLNRLKLISTAKKYNLISPSNLAYLEKDSEEYGKTLGVKTEKDITEKIHDIVRDKIPYFRSKIQKRFTEELDRYNLRSEEALVPKTQKELEQTSQAGKGCPFFSLEIEDFSYLYKLSRRILYDSKALLNCFIESAKTLDMDPSMLIRTSFPQNSLYIVLENDQAVVKNGVKVVKSFQTLKQAQLYVLTH